MTDTPERALLEAYKQRIRQTIIAARRGTDQQHGEARERESEAHAALMDYVAMLQSERDELLREIGSAPEGTHPDESRPRAETWHKERANWIAEVTRLRALLSAPPASEGEEYEVEDTFEPTMAVRRPMVWLDDMYLPGDCVTVRKVSNDKA